MFFLSTIRTDENLTKKVPSYTKSVSPSQRSIVFVHVGKAGGDTIRGTLRSSCTWSPYEHIRRQCRDEMHSNQPETALSRSMMGVIHTKRRYPIHGAQQATTFLWSVRNPIDRITSWFYYSHPRNCGLVDSKSPACAIQQKQHGGWAYDFYIKCFSDINDFAFALNHHNQGTYLEDPMKKKKKKKKKKKTMMTITTNATTTKTTTGMSCTEIAHLGLSGNIPDAGHLYYNYRYYANLTILAYPWKEILVVRAEHLWKDLQTIENLLWGGGPVLRNEDYVNHTHGSEKSYRSSLSSAGSKILCCHLHEEIRIYLRVLGQGLNLNDVDRESSLQSLLTTCGVDSFHQLQKDCDWPWMGVSEWFHS